jgi:hypothetical protein
MNDVVVRRGVNIKLQGEFNVTEKTVRLALQGKTRSALADKIRAAAVHRYGGRTENEHKVIILKK